MKKLLRGSLPEYEKPPLVTRKFIADVAFWLFIGICVAFACVTANADTIKPQIGTASWYGENDTIDPFPHNFTASGQRFNERALTAASWFYPLGSHVRVTNLDNGRSVVVLINDRGPGRHLVRRGRVIDLSKSAFEKIGFIGDGVIKVKIQQKRSN